MGSYELEGFKADQVNANGRIYPKDIILKAVAEAQKKVEDRMMFVYPVPGDEGLDKAIGIVTMLEADDDTGVVTCDWEELPTAKLPKDMLQLAPRGPGKLEPNEDGVNVVTEYELQCLDVIRVGM